MKVIKEVRGLKANGHYALALVEGNTIFVSGQFSVDPLTGERVFGTSGQEAERILSNIDMILKDLGVDGSHIVKTTVYTTSLADWGHINAAYADFFGNHTPARAVVEVKALHYDFKVEIEAQAVLKKYEYQA